MWKVKKMGKLLSILGVLIFLLIVNSKTGLAEFVGNEYCPVTKSEKVDKNIFVDYEGRRIYFCCQKCKRDFLAEPETYIGNLPAIEISNISDKFPNQGEDTVHSELDSAYEQKQFHESDLNHEHKNAQPNTINNEHDHATDHENSSSFISFIGKFHPLAVHFPIALVLIAAIFIVIYMLFGKVKYQELAILIMYWAALSAVIAAVLGLARASGNEFPSFLIKYFKWHRLLGLLSSGLTIATAISGFYFQRSSSRRAGIVFRILLILNAIAIGITGHLGGSLVYGPDYYSL